MIHSYPLIPAERVVPLLDEWHKTRSWQEIAQLTGVNQRTLYQMHRQEYVEFNTLDKLLTGMQCLELWQTDFAEYYLTEVA